MYRSIKLIFPFILSILLIILNSCDDGPTDPEVEPGKRNYVWEIDTLDVYAPISKIWGSEPNDVWAICYDGIWHYDGKEWKTDGISRPISPHALWGFTKDAVFIGGMNGKIWKYNGTSWRSFAELEKEGTDFIALENIWGTSSNNFYAVGAGPDDELFANHCVITHFDNNKWEIFDTDILKGNVVHFYTNKHDKKNYFRLTKIGGIVHSDSTIIYEYENKKFTKLYSSVAVHGLQADIKLINNVVYFILGNRIAIRRNNEFETVLNVNNSNFYQRIWGRNSKDIFLLMTDGLAHYNGNDIEYLFYFNVTPQTQIYGGAIFDDEVFFNVYEARTALKYIYHGILRD